MSKRLRLPLKESKPDDETAITQRSPSLSASYETQKPRHETTKKGRGEPSGGGHWKVRAYAVGPAAPLDQSGGHQPHEPLAAERRQNVATAERPWFPFTAKQSPGRGERFFKPDSLSPLPGQ